MAIFNMVGGGGSGSSIPDYLCFTTKTAGSTISLTKVGTPTDVTLETSTDGTTWTTYTFGTTITLSNVGDKIYWRNTSETDTGFSIAEGKNYKFVMTGLIYGSGDINFLLNKNSTTSIGSYCFALLFQGCSSLISAPKLTATSLGSFCYYHMFWNTRITIAPELPATSLPMGCYNYMFRDCSSLVIGPSIPATSISGNSCGYMFKGCTSLITLPLLKSLILGYSTYINMFEGCSKIKLSATQTGEYQKAYRIPTNGAGTTAPYALDGMFGGTGGTFKSTPSINTTYYTSNTVV